MPAPERVLQLYREAYRRHGDSPAAVLWPKGRQELRFSALARCLQGERAPTVLDFGCGLAHLYPFLEARCPGLRYTGVDAVAEFIDACRAKHPACEFRVVRDAREIEGMFDFVLLSGVFNLLYDADRAAHERMVFETLQALFGRAARALATSFMTDQVDYVQEGAYHQGIGSLLAFARRALSPRLVLDHSYMPYEYTLTVFKDAEIIRPDNVFRAHAADRRS